MHEDKYTRLFAGYNPALTPDNAFMSRLRQNLNSVRLVKEQTARMRRKNRLAVAIAAVTGFVSGILFTLCYPWIADIISSMITAGTTAAKLYADYGNVAVWSIICCMTATLSYSAYDITMLATGKAISSIRLH